MTCQVMEAQVRSDVSLSAGNVREGHGFLERVRLGDPRACERFVHEHAPRMLSVARRFLRCEHDAADAVQDAFASAFRALPAFEGQSTVSTWLHRIVVNACLMKLRADSRRRMASIEDLLPTFDETGRHARPVSRWAADDSRDVRKAVRDGIEQLPDAYRTVLLLRDIEGLDTEQTAGILGTTTANVKVRLHRARQALRSLLSRLFEDAYESCAA